MKHRFLAVAGAAALIGAFWPARDIPARAEGAGPVVVELFTSQSCYSCPPAEAYLGELARRDDLIALEFHVDYWNDLVHGAAGRWRDPFSRPAFTRRQRAYNQALRRRNSVYTPQMVIDGRHQAVGSKRGAVRTLLRKAAADGRARVSLAAIAGSAGLRVDLGGAAKGPGGIWLVRYIVARTTRVEAGENKGKTLNSRHIVTELRRIGTWRGAPATIRVAGFRLAAGEGCAILVQNSAAGPILGAGTCRSGES